MPGTYARPTGARIPLATTCRSVPSGRTDKTAASVATVVVQALHGAETPKTSRPSAAATMPLTSPAPAGSVTTLVTLPNRSPSRSA